jgi:recombination protein U
MHRGDSFQQIINAANEQYFNRGWAVILEVTAKASQKANGQFYYKKKTIATHSLDYLGGVDKLAITFDAKETRERTRFPLKNIKQDQIDVARAFSKHGYSFFLVNFVMLGKCYRLNMDVLNEYWDDYTAKAGPSSIPIEIFKEKCDLVKPERGILIDYLAGIEKYK